MYDLATIKSMNAERGREARKAGKEPFTITSESQISTMPPFPFPNIGSHRPKGWKLIEEYFVDSSGLGASDELALTTSQFKAKLKVGRAYAIIEEGQFQVRVGEFVRQ